MVKAAKRKKRKASKAKVKRGTWTPALVETMRGLWAEGIACAEIAARLGGGIDRLSVIRKAWVCKFGPHPAGRGAKKGPSPNEKKAAEASPNAPTASASPNGGYARNARWRDKNREAYNAAQRELMRRYRAGKQASRIAGVAS